MEGLKKYSSILSWDKEIIIFILLMTWPLELECQNIFLGGKKNARLEFSSLDPIHLAVLFSMFLKIDSMTTSLKRKVFPPSRQ